MCYCIHVYNCTGVQTHTYTDTTPREEDNKTTPQEARGLPRHQKRTKRKNRGNSYLIVKLLTNYCE